MTPIKPVSIVPPILAKSWRKIFIALLAWLVLYVLFDIPNRFFYWEREWQIPTDPREKAAYDFAHSIQLPKQAPKGGFKYLKGNKSFEPPVSENNMIFIETIIPEVPDPVPFNFAWARFKSLFGLDKPVQRQYFNHLCETEAAEYIYKQVDEMDGIYQMRYEPNGIDGRYATEAPTKLSQDPEVFVNPTYGVFPFFESMQGPRPYHTAEGTNSRWQITPAPDPNKTYIWHYENIKIPPPDHWTDRTPVNSIKATPVEQATARYANTWRGIKRQHDRRYGIAGYELIVLDRKTNQVLGFKREFRTARPKRGNIFDITWGGYACMYHFTGGGYPSGYFPRAFDMRNDRFFINQLFKPQLEKMKEDQLKYVKYLPKENEK